MEHKTGCLICGQELVYLQQDEVLACYYCGRPQATNARCIQGHYVCDACHSLSAVDLIEQFCVTTQQTDAMQMAITLMRNPSVKMHGPEHHFLVPAVLLTAFYNQGGITEKADKIQKARKRAEDVKGGFCGFYGNCGAAVGTGMFVSILTGATPLSTQDWKLCNRMTAESLMEIAEYGGPRCCKRDTFLALQTAARFIRQNFNPAFEMQESVTCEFYQYNRECLLTDCPFYPQ